MVPKAAPRASEESQTHNVEPLLGGLVLRVLLLLLGRLVGVVVVEGLRGTLLGVGHGLGEVRPRRSWWGSEEEGRSDDDDNTLQLAQDALLCSLQPLSHSQHRIHRRARVSLAAFLLLLDRPVHTRERIHCSATSVYQLYTCVGRIVCLPLTMRLLYSSTAGKERKEREGGTRASQLSLPRAREHARRLDEGEIKGTHRRRRTSAPSARRRPTTPCRRCGREEEERGARRSALARSHSEARDGERTHVWMKRLS